MKYKGILFDLDGVIVSTDDYHYRAWKEIADKEGIFFDRNINQRLRGVSRMESLEIVLEKATKIYTVEQKANLAYEKNQVYKELINQLSPSDLLEGVKEFLIECKNNNIKIGICSSSKNARFILNKIAMDTYFDCVVDGNDISHSKPDPEVFSKGCEALDLKPYECLVVEDAFAGVDAGFSAGCDVLAVGYASSYQKATYKATNIAKIKFDSLL